MGTDIHAVFERYDAALNIWSAVESGYECERHYQLFAWLGNVRNGTGFAGIRTGDPIKPLQDCRGLPLDFIPPPDEGEYAKPGERLWMGDHSFGWLLVSEILSQIPGQTIQTGVLELEHFRGWDGRSEPHEYSGDVVGRDVLVSAPELIEPATTHVRVSWMADLSEAFEYFLAVCRDLQEQHGCVRFVFGFDS